MLFKDIALELLVEVARLSSLESFPPVSWSGEDCSVGDCRTWPFCLFVLLPIELVRMGKGCD